MRAELEYLKEREGMKATLEETYNDGQDTVRCVVCGTTDENYDEENDPHGDMVQCDGCDTWQHIKCMTGKDVLEASSTYYCNVCNPSAYPDVKCAIDPTYFAKSKNLKRRSQNEEDSDHVEDEEYRVEGNDIPGQVSGENRRSSNNRKKSRKSEVTQESKLRESALKMLTDLFRKYIIPESLASGTLKEDITDNRAEDLARELEGQLFESYYKSGENAASMYTEKVRMIYSNLKDQKNAHLKKLVATKAIPYEKLVKMSVNELINPDLREFREKVGNEASEQLIFEQPNRPKYIKTHKGDELIEDPNAFEPEDIIFSKDIILSKHDDSYKEEIGLAQSDKSTRRVPPSTASLNGDSIKNEEVRISNCTIQYDEINAKFVASAKFLGSSRPLNQRVCTDAMNSHLFTVEGRLSSDEGDKYLNQMLNTRILVVYELIPNEHPSDQDKFSEFFEFLSKRHRYGALKTNREYVRHIYVIPWNNGEDHTLFNLIPSIENSIKMESRALLVVAVVREDLLKD